MAPLIFVWRPKKGTPVWWNFGGKDIAGEVVKVARDGVVITVRLADGTEGTTIPQSLRPRAI